MSFSEGAEAQWHQATLAVTGDKLLSFRSPISVECLERSVAKTLECDDEILRFIDADDSVLLPWDSVRSRVQVLRLSRSAHFLELFGFVGPRQHILSSRFFLEYSLELCAGDTPLHAVARVAPPRRVGLFSGHPQELCEVVTELLDAKALVDSQNRYGDTPLWISVSNNDDASLAVAETLLSRGASPRGLLRRLTGEETLGYAEPPCLEAMRLLCNTGLLDSSERFDAHTLLRARFPETSPSFAAFLLKSPDSSANSS